MSSYYQEFEPWCSDSAKWGLINELNASASSSGRWLFVAKHKEEDWEELSRDRIFNHKYIREYKFPNHFEECFKILIRMAHAKKKEWEKEDAIVIQSIIHAESGWQKEYKDSLVKSGKNKLIDQLMELPV